MPAQSKRYLLLLLTIASAIGTLISAFFLFAQQNEYTLEEAIDGALVTVQIHGIAEDGRFLEPMVKITLKKEAFWPLTIIIEQGLMLQSTSESESGAADLVTLQRKKITFNESFSDLFAYTLDYSKSFPNNKSEYTVIGMINENLKPVLNNIVGLEAEKELSSQLAVWISHNDVKLAKIEEALGQDFSEYSERVDEILQATESPLGSPSSSWQGFAALVLSTVLTLVFGSLFWKSAPSRRVIDQLTNWKPLAKGGMAEVWVARYKQKKVIVKFPREASKKLHADTIDYRFKVEIKQHQKLSHPNIVPLIEPLTKDNQKCIHPKSKKETRYLIQEFVHGCTLDHLLNQQPSRRLPESIILEIIDKVLAALTYIHSKEVIHRDLTLKNIMVKTESGEVYLIDFGNSTRIDSRDTRIGGLPSVGTVPFYAPATKIGNEPRRDFYALAVVVYAMYGGQLLKGEIPETEAIKAKIEQEVENLQSMPDSLRVVLQKCLNGDYQNSGALRKALGRSNLKDMMGSIDAQSSSSSLGDLSQKATESRELL